MAHRIGRHEDIGPALWRLIREDLTAARRDLAGSHPREKSIHRVRQRLKRLRTLLRVLAPALGDQAPQAKRRLRDTAHCLAGARDADAAAASARGLRAATGRGDDAGLDRVVAELVLKAAQAHSRQTPAAEIAMLILQAEADFARAPLDIDGEALLADALRRSYRKGRRAMRDAETSLATPDLHAWRKAVKDLWHLVRLARKRLPHRLGETAERLAMLGERLGLDRDHAMLAERLALSPTADPALMRQLALIARERRSLEAAAFEIGGEVFRRRPREFAARCRLE